jgi:ATP-dependent Clp protease protease subunit
VEASLFARRIVMVSGTIDDARAGRIATALMALDALGDEHVELRLSSAEATVGAAATLTDIVDVLGVPVHVSAAGLVGGGAAGILAAGAWRRIAAHGAVRLSRPDEPAPEGPIDLARWADGHEARQARFCARLGADTDRPVGEVTEALRAGRFLDAAQALAWGIVDEVERPARRAGPTPLR